MVDRRKLHKIFDLIKCDAWMTLLEKKGFASEKNFVLKECYFSLHQLVEYREGHLKKKLHSMMSVLLDHLQACHKCDLKKQQCEICMGGVLYYEFDIEVAGECVYCLKKGHLSCMQRHVCNAITNELLSNLHLG